MHLYKTKPINNKYFISLIVFSLLIFISCSKKNSPVIKKKGEKAIEKVSVIETKQHKYGGWYCPDNLNGFPAVDINNWKSVPVVNGRLPTKEETQNGSSLIFIDIEKYPNAKALNIKLPKLARFYNRNSKKKELVIVIQAINVLKDSIVGFRYLNGGNGSAYLNKVEFLTDIETDNLSTSRFVSLNIEINAPQSIIWDVLTNPKFRNILQPSLNNDDFLIDLNNSSKVNYSYSNKSEITSEFADQLFGNYYIQIDYKGEYQQVEKFLLLDNKQSKSTELQIVCGPYRNDYENQKIILNSWAKRVKELSEKNNVNLLELKN